MEINRRVFLGGFVSLIAESLPVFGNGYHVIQKGDNPTSICKKYGVSLEDFRIANPGLDEHHLKIKKRVIIPEQKIEDAKEYIPQHISNRGIEHIKKYGDFNLVE
jgi:hypothetical protein